MLNKDETQFINSTANEMPCCSIKKFNSKIALDIRCLRKHEIKKKQRLNSMLTCDHNIKPQGRAAIFGYYDIDYCTKCGYECVY